MCNFSDLVNWLLWTLGIMFRQFLKIVYHSEGPKPLSKGSKLCHMWAFLGKSYEVCNFSDQFNWLLWTLGIMFRQVLKMVYLSGGFEQGAQVMPNVVFSWKKL